MIETMADSDFESSPPPAAKKSKIMSTDQEVFRELLDGHTAVIRELLDAHFKAVLAAIAAQVPPAKNEVDTAPAAGGSTAAGISATPLVTEWRALVDGLFQLRPTDTAQNAERIWSGQVAGKRRVYVNICSGKSVPCPAGESHSISSPAKGTKKQDLSNQVYFTFFDGQWYWACGKNGCSREEIAYPGTAAASSE